MPHDINAIISAGANLKVGGMALDDVRREALRVSETLGVGQIKAALRACGLKSLALSLDRPNKEFSSYLPPQRSECRPTTTDRTFAAGNGEDESAVHGKVDAPGGAGRQTTAATAEQVLTKSAAIEFLQATLKREGILPQAITTAFSKAKPWTKQARLSRDRYSKSKLLEGARKNLFARRLVGTIIGPSSVAERAS